MGKWSYLLWCDLESTGTDEDLDPILEVAWVITERAAPWTELSHGQLVVDPFNSGFASWRLRMNDYVLNMHTETGLLAEIDAGKGVLIDDVQDAIISQLSLVGRKHDFLLAGSGVSHFDHRMIAAQMPRVEKWLQYPNHDVGNVRRALEMLEGGSEFADEVYGTNISLTGGKKHRAMDDIRDHMNEWRVYAEFLQKSLDARKGLGL